MLNKSITTHVTQEGLVIPTNVLIGLHFHDNVSIVKKEDLIILKQKYLTDKVRGIIKESKLSRKDIDDLWFEEKSRIR